ncbi:MAG: NADPH-dependent glutamate synthase [Thermoanaerobaculaceae bacterium]|nr:NADPH-dependent glutamate synthase [Thermoanaerobaculaceae bacterium]
MADEILGAPELPKAERMKIQRHPMAAQEPLERIRNFFEVALGYSTEFAIDEAQRCLQCANPPCVKGCPVGIDIPAFVDLIRRADFEGSLAKIKETNMLPAICGRVCPQEEQCEVVCVLAKKYKPVAIGRLERFVADWERDRGLVSTPELAPPTAHKVAVVGSGPAGLACAAELARFGHKVTIFEALHKPGGVLVYGIPEFRLPKAIVTFEIENLTRMGVELRTDFVIGRTSTVHELFSVYGYDAVFLGTGAGLPYFLGIPGENYIGVLSANEFLTRVNLMKAYDFPRTDTPVRTGRRVAVVGSGNVAMDCLRTAKRLGAGEVICVYRRTRNESPARKEELEHAEEEAIDFRWLSAPVAILGNEEGFVTGMRIQRMELGEPDASGRRRPVPIEGSEYEIAIDTAVIAIGQGPNPLATKSTPGLELNRHGNIVADEKTLMTSIPGVFAGGDIVTGAATVILAMGAGKQAALGIQDWLARLARGEVAKPQLPAA